VAVDYVSDVEASAAYFVDAPDLVVEVIAVETVCSVDVREDPIGAPFADVKCLAVSRVDEPVDVPAQSAGDFRREGFSLHARMMHDALDAVSVA
jgi:hypothetical protein